MSSVSGAGWRRHRGVEAPDSAGSSRRSARLRLPRADTAPDATTRLRTVVQNSHESRRKYWAVRSSIRTAHSFACFGLLDSLAPSAALTRSLALSLRSLPRSSENNLVLSHVLRLKGSRRGKRDQKEDAELLLP